MSLEQQIDLLTVALSENTAALLGCSTTPGAAPTQPTPALTAPAAAKPGRPRKLPPAAVEVAPAVDDDD